MHPDEFAVFSQEIDQRSNKILVEANKEYASDEDKLENFKMLALLLKAYRPHLKDVSLDILAEDVAWVYRLKHVIAQMKDVSVREDMLGRTIDDINYAKLLAALRKERLTPEKPIKLERSGTSGEGALQSAWLNIVDTDDAGREECAS